MAELGNQAHAWMVAHMAAGGVQCGTCVPAVYGPDVAWLTAHQHAAHRTTVDVADWPDSITTEQGTIWFTPPHRIDDQASSMRPMGWEHLTNASGQLNLAVRRMAEAAITMGWNTERWQAMIAWAQDINSHFNPSVRISHGRNSEEGNCKS